MGLYLWSVPGAALQPGPGTVGDDGHAVAATDLNIMAGINIPV